MGNYFSAVKKVNPRGVEDDVLEIFVDTYDIYRLNNLVAEAGTYTFVVWYSAKADCNITFNILGTEEKVAACATWGKLVKTVEYSGIGSNNIDITQDLGSTIYLYEAYITKGSQDKSWSLAPEDWEDGRKERDDLINETMTFAQQTSDKFAWIVKDGTNETNFTLTSRTADLVSEQINLRGLVSFTSLNSVDFGSTNIIVRAGELMNAKLNSDGTIESLAGDSEGDGTIFYSRVMDDFIPVTAGEKLTFSQIFDKNNYGDNFFRYCFYEADKTTVVSYGYDNSEKFTFAAPEGAVYLRVSYDGANKVKLERSGNASEWSIADYLLGETAEGQTTIHGGYIKTGTIKSDKIDVDSFFANEAVVSHLKAIEIDADRIISGYINTDRLDLHGLSVKHRTKVNANGMPIETLGISDNGDVTLRGSIESYDYVSGESGWSINSNGNMELNNLVARGDLINPYGGIISTTGDTVEINAWFGASYEERKSAPFIVYSDGTMVATKGTFGGVFTGDIQIGNISIVDPSNVTGNDAILTIQNGSNGTKAVRLRDTDISSFGQNIEIGEYHYSGSSESFTTNIYLGQDGNAKFNQSISVGDKTSLNNGTLTLNGQVLDTNSNGYVFKTSQVDIGSTSVGTDLNVYGDATINGQLQLLSTLLFGNVVKCTATTSGLNFNFIN